MAAAPLIIAAIGAVVSAAGQVRQGNVAKNAAEYNAVVAEQGAATTRSQGTIRQEALRERARQTIGQQLAAGAESGTTLNGSNLDALSDSMYNAELDALNIRYESELNATGMLNQATLDKYQGQQAAVAGGISAAGSLLNSYSSYKGSGGKLPGKAGAT